MSKRSQLSTASNEQNQSYLTDQMVDINFCCFEIATGILHCFGEYLQLNGA